MPFSAEHMLLQWSGTFSRGSDAPVIDEFAGTLRFTGPGVEAVDNQEACDALAAVMATFWKVPAAQLPSIARLSVVKWNRIGTDGRYASQNQTTMTILDTPATGPVVPVYPTQIAWATTYRTDFSRGRASRGRNYWPTAVTVGAGEEMRTTALAARNMAGAVATLIANLNAAIRTEGGGLVASVMSDLGDGRSAAIRRVEVGNRLDIQRRRANRVDETYEGTDVVATPPV